MIRVHYRKHLAYEIFGKAKGFDPATVDIRYGLVFLWIAKQNLYKSVHVGVMLAS